MAKKKEVYVLTGWARRSAMRSPRRDVAAGARGPSLAAVWAYSMILTGVLASASVSVFGDLDLPDVPRVDALSLDEPAVEAQGGVPHPRPHLHLCRHRGSYTPVALMVIGGWQGLHHHFQWAMVIFGIFYKSLSRKSISAISHHLSGHGWTIVFFLPLAPCASLCRCW